jgi:transposase-like protein
VLVRDVAESLDIHPFLLSKWRMRARDVLPFDPLSPLGQSVN